MEELQKQMIEAFKQGDTEKYKSTLLPLDKDLYDFHYTTSELCVAADKGDVQTLERLLKEGANPNLQGNNKEIEDKPQYTFPLYLALQQTCPGKSQKLLKVQPYLDCAQILLQHGASTDLKDKWGKSARDYLHHDCPYCFELTKDLVDKCNLKTIPEANEQQPYIDKLGNTLLHYSDAKYIYGTEDFESEVNHQNIFGQTPLHLPSQTALLKRRKLITYAHAGGDLYIKDCSGKAPLHYMHEHTTNTTNNDSVRDDRARAIKKLTHELMRAYDDCYLYRIPESYAEIQSTHQGSEFCIHFAESTVFNKKTNQSVYSAYVFEQKQGPHLHKNDVIDLMEKHLSELPHVAWHTLPQALLVYERHKDESYKNYVVYFKWSEDEVIVSEVARILEDGSVALELRKRTYYSIDSDYKLSEKQSSDFDTFLTVRGRDFFNGLGKVDVDMALESTTIDEFRQSLRVITTSALLHQCTKSKVYSTVYIKELILAGADFNAQDSEGNTPLHLLANNTSQDLDIVKCLLEAEADPTCKNHEGMTALDIVRTSSEMTDMAELLHTFEEKVRLERSIQAHSSKQSVKKQKI